MFFLIRQDVLSKQIIFKFLKEGSGANGSYINYIDHFRGDGGLRQIFEVLYKYNLKFNSVYWKPINLFKTSCRGR